MTSAFKRTAIVATLLLGASSTAYAADQGQIGPPLQTVKTFGDDFHLVGLAVSKTGRIFATAPSGNVRSKYSMVEVDPKSGDVKPYPDEQWNTFTDEPNGKPEWISVQALWVDKADHLWALDCSLSKVDQDKLPPKLVEFDLKTNKVIRQYGFKGVVSPKDSLNDLRIDVDHGYAYLTNIGSKGSLVVLNLKTGASRQVLVGDRSTLADPNEHLMIGKDPALRPDGSVATIHADGIAMSPDGRWLYYRPLTDHNYWRVPTAALRDAKLSEADLARKVEFLGTAEMTGGLIMGTDDTLYGGDLENATVVALKLSNGKFKSKVFVSDPGKLSWADGFAIHDGYLYIADSHLWEVAFKNNRPRSGPFAIFKVKLPDGGASGH